MEPGMEIVSSDGRRVGHVGLAQAGGLGIAKSEKMIPADWIARVDREVILRKTLKEVMAGLGNAPVLRVESPVSGPRMAGVSSSRAPSRPHDAEN